MESKSKDLNDNDNNSTNSVLNLSLEDSNSQKSLSLSTFDLNNSLRNGINLPIETDSFIDNSEKEDEKEINLSEKDSSDFENYLKEKEEEYEGGEIINKKRSKTQIIQKNNVNSLGKSPKIKPKISQEIISPLKLTMKTYGNIVPFLKKPNSIITDYQKNILDSKSCNDEEKSDNDYFILDESETERTTPNLEDLNNLLNCRKKMTIFRNSISTKIPAEYENILNTDLINIDINSNHHKKNSNFWHRHIQQQKMRMSCKIITKDKLFGSIINDTKFKRAESTCINKDELIKDHGLFILGILESAANEKKRKTSNFD